jgi:hypothetical protein
MMRRRLRRGRASLVVAGALASSASGRVGTQAQGLAQTATATRVRWLPLLLTARTAQLCGVDPAVPPFGKLYVTNVVAVALKFSK